MQFKSSGVDNLSEIQSWIDQDTDHQNKMRADWWLTGNLCLLAGRVEDDIGTVVYFRVDNEDCMARLHVQFAPSDEVIKPRLIKAILIGYYKIETMMKLKKMKGIVFDSQSRDLIRFMSKLGFRHLDKDDYVLRFEEQHENNY